MPGGIVRHGCHLRLGRPVPGGWRQPGCDDVTSWRSGPARCDIVAVGGAVTGAAAARREGPPGPARREGCARRRRPAAQHSPPGSRAIRPKRTQVTRSTISITIRESQPFIFSVGPPRTPAIFARLGLCTSVSVARPPKIERAEVCVPVLAGVRRLGRTGRRSRSRAASSSSSRSADLPRDRIPPGEPPGQRTQRPST